MVEHELDQWEVAYEELRREHLRLQHENVKLKRALAHAYDALDNYEFIATYTPDPFAF